MGNYPLDGALGWIGREGFLLASHKLASHTLANKNVGNGNQRQLINGNRPLKDTPTTLLAYLLHDGSLTSKLERQSGQRLCVDVRFLGFCLLLDNGKRQLAWVRMVDLKIGGQVWVQAQTVILVRQLKGQARMLQFLTDRPIGHVLFQRQRQLPYVRRFFKKAGRFARQTAYEWQGCKVMIEEVFVGESFAAGVDEAGVDIEKI